MSSTQTLKVARTGQVTIPKVWRDKFDVDHFQATETEEGILLKPIGAHYDEVVFDPPVPVEKLLKKIRAYRKKHDGR